MQNKITLIIIFLAICFIIYFLLSKRLGNDQKLPYKKREFLMNIPERLFYEKLLKLIPSGYVVYPQVVLSSIVSVDSNRKAFRKWQNKINKKTIDFVIFKKPYIKPIAAIEYNGSTHKRKDRSQRDEFVNSVLSSAGISILHFRHKDSTESDVIEFLKFMTSL